MGGKVEEQALWLSMGLPSYGLQLVGHELLVLKSLCPSPTSGILFFLPGGYVLN